MAEAGVVRETPPAFCPRAFAGEVDRRASAETKGAFDPGTVKVSQ